MTAVERQMAADAIALSKEHADRADAAEARWAALRTAVTTERTRRGEAADKAPSYELQNRYWGWTDALDWVLALLDPEARRPAPPAKRPVLTSMYVFDVLCSAGFTPRGNGEPGFTTGWYMDAITVDHVGADLPVHGPLEGPRAIIAGYARTLDEAGFDTHVTVNTVLVRKRTPAKTATAGEE